MRELQAREVLHVRELCLQFVFLDGEILTCLGNGEPQNKRGAIGAYVTREATMEDCNL